MAKTASAKTTVEPDGDSRSAKKRKAILDAATEVFLRSGYLGTNMDEIAALSGVSKQTVYKHFSSKEALFIEIVTSMTGDAGDLVGHELSEFQGGDLGRISFRICPPPALHRADAAPDAAAPPGHRRGQPLSRSGEGSLRKRSGRAMSALAANFESLAKRGLIEVDDPKMAASHFNWLVMSDALNRAMLLGDGAIPKPAELRRQAAEGVRVFLAAYGRRR